MTRDAWECSSGPWQAQNRRSILIGKAILDPNCPIRRHPTRSHGPTRNSSNWHSSPPGVSCRNRSNNPRVTTLALSTSCSTDMCPSVCIYYDKTDEGGISPLRLRRLRLADSPTLLHQRSDHCSARILSSPASRIPHNHSDARTSYNSDHSVVCRRSVLFATQSSPNTILIVC